MSDLCVVTGDRGFVGSRLRQALLARGRRVLGLDRLPAAAGLDGYEGRTLDLADRDAVQALFEAIDTPASVFHLAARLSTTDDDPLAPHLEANLRTTQNLLAALDGRGVPMVFSSTMSVYGLAPERLPVGEDQMPFPTEAYGLTKFAAEAMVERAARTGRVPAAVLRYSGIFGAGYAYGAIHLYASRALAGEAVSVYGRGRIVRDYVHVDDVVEANLLASAAARRLGWGLYHIGGGSPLPLADIARRTVEAAGGGRVETGDPEGARLHGAVGRALPGGSGPRPRDQVRLRRQFLHGRP